MTSDDRADIGHGSGVVFPNHAHDLLSAQSQGLGAETHRAVAHWPADDGREDPALELVASGPALREGSRVKRGGQGLAWEEECHWSGVKWAGSEAS